MDKCMNTETDNQLESSSCLEVAAAKDLSFMIYVALPGM